MTPFSEDHVFGVWTGACEAMMECGGNSHATTPFNRWSRVRKLVKVGRKALLDMAWYPWTAALSNFDRTFTALGFSFVNVEAHLH